jgi:hypothetical protein
VFDGGIAKFNLLVDGIRFVPSHNGTDTLVLKAIHHSLFRVKAYGAGPPINGVRNKAVGLYLCVCTRFDDLTVTPFDGQSLDWPQALYEQCIMYQQTPEIQRAFLDGFADADGSRLVRGNYDVKVILLANRLLIDDLRHMARSLGYRVTNVTEQRRSVNYDLPPNSSAPQEWFSAVFRYHWQSRRDAAFTLSRVTSIKPCGRERVFDISVDGDANFIADGLVAHNTRWHTDDILGRFMERYPELRMLSYPAIAEHDERHRRKGEPLFPELKPLDFLLDRKRMLTQPSW